jgi:hypothetical protein
MDAKPEYLAIPEPAQKSVWINSGDMPSCAIGTGSASVFAGLGVRDKKQEKF